jgi:hypothetical protein
VTHVIAKFQHNFVFCSVKIIKMADMRASCAYYVLDLGCCRKMCIWPVLELCSPSGGRLQKVPNTICSPSNRMSGHSVSCLWKLSHMVKHRMQVSVMSITCTVKVSNSMSSKFLWVFQSMLSLNRFLRHTQSDIYIMRLRS